MAYWAVPFPPSSHMSTWMSESPGRVVQIPLDILWMLRLTSCNTVHLRKGRIHTALGLSENVRSSSDLFHHGSTDNAKTRKEVKKKKKVMFKCVMKIFIWPLNEYKWLLMHVLCYRSKKEIVHPLHPQEMPQVQRAASTTKSAVSKVHKICKLRGISVDCWHCRMIQGITLSANESHCWSLRLIWMAKFEQGWEQEW